jgi:hypothetical protein
VLFSAAVIGSRLRFASAPADEPVLLCTCRPCQGGVALYGDRGKVHHQCCGVKASHIQVQPADSLRCPIVSDIVKLLSCIDVLCTQRVMGFRTVLVLGCNLWHVPHVCSHSASNASFVTTPRVSCCVLCAMCCALSPAICVLCV